VLRKRDAFIVNAKRNLGQGNFLHREREGGLANAKQWGTLPFANATSFPRTRRLVIYGGEIVVSSTRTRRPRGRSLREREGRLANAKPTRSSAHSEHDSPSRTRRRPDAQTLKQNKNGIFPIFHKPSIRTRVRGDFKRRFSRFRTR